MCVFTFLQTVIKELNLKFKIKENPHGIKRETIILQMEVKMTFYMKKVTHRMKTTMKMISVAVTAIFWVPMMNKLYYGC
jgi:hypothetical protein